MESSWKRVGEEDRGEGNRGREKERREEESEGGLDRYG